LSKAEAFFERLLFLRNSEAPDVSSENWIIFLTEFHIGQEFSRMENVHWAIVGIAWNGDVSDFSPEFIGLSIQTTAIFFWQRAQRTGWILCLQSKIRPGRTANKFGHRKCKASCEYFCVCGGASQTNKALPEWHIHSCRNAGLPAARINPSAMLSDSLEKQHGLSCQPAQSIRRRVDCAVVISREWCLLLRPANSPPRLSRK